MNENHQHPDLLQTLTRLQGQVLDIANRLTDLTDRVGRLEASVDALTEQDESEEPGPTHL